jgi:integrase
LQPDAVTFDVLSSDTVEGFLAYLEQVRGCGVKTRNLRRATILSFTKYASKKAFTSSPTFYTAMTDIPKKREPKKIRFKHFTQDEIAILLKIPDSAKTIGRRDIILLSLLYATGARAQELCDITLGDIIVG